MMSLALLVAGTLAGLSSLHLYWAVGGRWGHGVTLPERHGARWDRRIYTPLALALGVGTAIIAAGTA